jgi:dTDP-glucose 4,6-dehydratase
LEHLLGEIVNINRRVMVTGGAGFIGSNLVRMILAERPAWEIVNFDLLTYAGNLASLADIAGNPRYHFVKGDIADAGAVEKAMSGCWGVMHLAAESHVDRSILDASPFIRTNVLGTQVMLDIARKLGVQRYLQVSTDEVYGSLTLDEPPFNEMNLIKPNSPYAASKASGDLLVRAYHKPTIFQRSSRAALIITAPASFLRSLSRCSSPTHLTIRRFRSMAMECRFATGFM